MDNSTRALNRANNGSPVPARFNADERRRGVVVIVAY